ncbi:MAG: FkbM family methyltransferase [Acidobacteriales bacterium]|nr:FkbM family methyltransferase [Terriglobales bacterium]
MFSFSAIESALRKSIHRLRGLRFRPYWINYSFPDGTRVPFCIGDEVGRRWYHESSGDGGRAEGLLAAYDQFVAADDRILECGPHHGLVTLYFSLRTAGRILCVEANKNNVAILRRNIQGNGLEGRVQALQYAISGRDHESLRMVDSSNAYLAHETRFAAFHVESITVDTVCARNAFSPTFVKLDIEGAEMEAVKGAQQIFATCPKINIEVHCKEIRERYGKDPDAILSDLPPPKNYEWLLLRDDRVPGLEPFPGTFAGIDRCQIFGIPR